MMSRVSSIVVVVALCGSASIGQVQRSSKAQKPLAPAPQPQVTQPTPASVQTAPPPPTPEQGPSSPPKVTFQAGQLTIEARNSTMGDVLNAVKQKTGAAVDMPGASSERVVGRFGPGAPRDVMAQLLNGSHYDYVLLGSPADPGALKKIVLIARVAGPEPAPSPQPGQQAYQQNQNLQTVPDVEAEQNVSEDNATEMQQPPEDE